MPQSLDGVQVVDFTQIIAGPAATRQLALHGAEVIKVETPDGGDIMRGMMAEGTFAEHRISPMFQYLNGGKRSLTLNLKSTEGIALARELIDRADVVVDNFRPGVMSRLGLDPDDCRRRNPGRVWCAISGYGQVGPKAGLAAYDGPLQADTGIMSVNGLPDGDPTRLGIMAIDMYAGSMAATAILSALLRRSATGEGQFIDASLLDGALHLMAPQIMNFANGGHVPGRNGNRTEAGLPTDNLFPTATDSILVTAINDGQVMNLLKILGRDDLTTDPRLATNDARMSNREFIEGTISDALSADTAENWENKIRGAGIPCARVRTVPEVVEDPQLAAGERLVEAPLPDGITADPAVILSGGYQADGDGPVCRAAPLLGGDTGAILRELGRTDDEIAALRKDGAV